MNPNVVVVGAGIIGASVAYHLAKLGARVVVLERNSSAGADITGISFGWVGLVNSDPSDNVPAFKFRASAVDEYRRLQSELGSSFQKSVTGALVWSDNEETIHKLMKAHQEQDSELQLLTSTQISNKEPCLTQVPSVAAFAPNDFAIEPTKLTEQLLRAAIEKGTKVVFEAEAVRIETKNNRAVSVITKTEIYPADMVVIANGTNAEALVSEIAPDFKVESSPATFLRLTTNNRLANHILSCDQFELRPSADHSTVLAEWYPEDGDAGLIDLAERRVDTIKRHFNTDGEILVDTVKAGFRPYPKNGQPCLGFLEGTGNVYTAIAHPGVILAPFVGRTASEELLNS